MSVRPPRILARWMDDNPLQGLQHEVLEEKVATLSRLGRRLEQALERLAAFEARAEGGGHQTGGERERLLAEAGEALWHLVIQREAMGLRNTEQALKIYKVPQAVRLRMGAAPRPADAADSPAGLRRRARPLGMRPGQRDGDEDER